MGSKRSYRSHPMPCGLLRCCLAFLQDAAAVDMSASKSPSFCSWRSYASTPKALDYLQLLSSACVWQQMGGRQRVLRPAAQPVGGFLGVSETPGAAPLARGFIGPGRRCRGGCSESQSTTSHDRACAVFISHHRRNPTADVQRTRHLTLSSCSSLCPRLRPRASHRSLSAGRVTPTHLARRCE